MKLSISNIAWDPSEDDGMYQFLYENGYDGIEIAPPRVFGQNPYEKHDKAKEFKRKMWDDYKLRISSMQSIWFGRTENLFEDAKQREILFEYTKRAIEFANILECHNLVFGCPRNRNQNQKLSNNEYVAKDFFRKLGEYAYSNNTVLTMEANPPIYNTNYINDTEQAFEIVKEISNKGFLVNLDIGTIIQNNEDISNLVENLKYINHVHISEPYLAPVTFSDIQEKVIIMLKNSGYENYFSIEMSNINDIDRTKKIALELLKYV